MQAFQNCLLQLRCCKWGVALHVGHNISGFRISYTFPSAPHCKQTAYEAPTFVYNIVCCICQTEKQTAQKPEIKLELAPKGYCIFTK